MVSDLSFCPRPTRALFVIFLLLKRLASLLFYHEVLCRSSGAGAGFDCAPPAFGLPSACCLPTRFSTAKAPGTAGFYPPITQMNADSETENRIDENNQSSGTGPELQINEAPDSDHFFRFFGLFFCSLREPASGGVPEMGALRLGVDVEKDCSA